MAILKLSKAMPSIALVWLCLPNNLPMSLIWVNGGIFWDFSMIKERRKKNSKIISVMLMVFLIIKDGHHKEKLILMLEQ